MMLHPPQTNQGRAALQSLQPRHQAGMMLIRPSIPSIQRCSGGAVLCQQLHACTRGAARGTAGELQAGQEAQAAHVRAHGVQTLTMRRRSQCAGAAHTGAQHCAVTRDGWVPCARGCGLTSPRTRVHIIKAKATPASACAGAAHRCTHSSSCHACMHACIIPSAAWWAAAAPHPAARGQPESGAGRGASSEQGGR